MDIVHSEIKDFNLSEEIKKIQGEQEALFILDDYEIFIGGEQSWIKLFIETF